MYYRKICKVKPKKSDFLTIPEATNYEINGYLTVRNKTTGKKLKDSQRIDLCTPNGKITRSVHVLYRRALAQIETETWRPIGSLGGKYEMNFEGAVRNSRTKRILKPQLVRGSLRYYIKYGGKTVCRLWTQLMNEVNGTNLGKSKRPIKVQLQRDGRQWFFRSIKACARFLSPRVFFSVSTLKAKMARRPQDIFGWSAKYF